VEAVTARALYFAAALADEPADREHVTRYIVRRPSSFLLRSVLLETPRAGLEDDRWTLDTPDDYELLSRVFELLRDRGAREDRARFREVLAIIDANPDLRQLNAHVAQKVA
jgi:spore coat polysaccharide biosynthesis protein SpsF